MSIAIQTSGPFFSNQRNQLFEKAKRNGLTRLGTRNVAALKRDAPRDTEKFANSITFRIEGSGANLTLVIYATAKYAQWVESGRKPGKAPPPNVMLRLVQRKGLGSRNRSARTGRALASGVTRSRNRSGRLRTRTQSLLVIQKSIAFLIGRSIGKKGTKGTFIFRDNEKRHRALIATAVREMERDIYKALGA